MGKKRLNKSNNIATATFPGAGALSCGAVVGLIRSRKVNHDKFSSKITMIPMDREALLQNESYTKNRKAPPKHQDLHWTEEEARASNRQ